MIAGQLPDNAVLASFAHRYGRQQDLFLPEPQQNLSGTPQLRHLTENQLNGLLNALIRVLLAGLGDVDAGQLVGEHGEQHRILALEQLGDAVARQVIPALGTQLLDNQALLHLNVDVLLPAAMEGQITRDNAGEIQARIIVEGANGPTTPDADEILIRRGVLVVPDILANAGGVVVSCFEWVQDRNGYFWKEAEVTERLEEKMVAAFDAVWATKEKFEVNTRTAAYILAVDRIIEARSLRGLYA